ncbi:MAG TPA: hypothetical protein VJT67_16130 [Longimicrobiaceae bacterium]|nr:hypothetical protein [Longimicrobiaceae bacterium]
MDTDGCTIDMLQPITLQASPGPVPDGMKVTALADPNTLQMAKASPALAVGSFTLFPFSYYDNRVSFGMVMYDPKGKVVGMMEKPGARYVTSITKNGSGHDGTVTVTGQANQTVTLACKEIDALLTGSVIS